MADELAPRPPAAAAIVQWLLTGASEQDVLEALRAKYPEADAGATEAGHGERGSRSDVDVAGDRDQPRSLRQQAGIL